MALTFTTLPDSSKWHLTDSNLVFRFSDPFLTATSCNVTITSINVPIVLYPSPDNSFYFNARAYLRPLPVNINIDVYQEPYDINSPDTFNRFWDNAFNRQQIVFFVIFADGSQQQASFFFNCLLGYESALLSKMDGSIADDDGALLFYRSKERTISYSEGLPFDFGYTNSLTGQFIIFENLTTSNSFSISNAVNMNRLIIDSGNGVTLQPWIGLQMGINKIKFLDNIFYIDKKRPKCGGLYVKWLNNYGAFSYWYFDSYSITSSSINRGVINNDGENVPDTLMPSISIGRSFSYQIRASYSSLSVEEGYLLSGILESLSIYVYTGEPGVLGEWFQVTMGNTSFVRKSFKGLPEEGVFTFELGQNDGVGL